MSQKSVSFKFKTNKRPLHAQVYTPRPGSFSRSMPKEKPGLVFGVKPDSVQEWRFAQGLLTLKLYFQYQVPVAGGRMIRGGQIVDFLVYATALPTPVFIWGEYYHNESKRTEDMLKVMMLRQEMGKQIADPVIILASELPSVDVAISVIRRRIYV